jgi:NodT family efflux transporter outer membrane factor (OMF) lipoprotein
MRDNPTAGPCRLRFRPGLAAALLAALTAAALASCAPEPRKLSSPMQVPESFSDSGGRQVPDRWWTAFGDRGLSSLIEMALGGNFDLKAAWQRLREARAVADRESATLFPDLDAFSDAEIRRSESGSDELLRIGLASSYEVDLWGRIRAGVQADRFRARASLADYRSAALTLSAEVTRAWFRLAAARSRMELLQRQIEANRKVLSLIEARFRTGQTRMVDILRQRQLVEATRQQKRSEESRIRVLEHQLAVLAGRTPQSDVRYEAGSLPEPPPLPETGLPTDLVRRRPDVRRAYNRLRAADRDWAAAVSNRYPRLTLTGSLSTASSGAGSLFEEWARSFASELVAPLLDAGRREAEADRTEAVRRQRLFEYGQAILTAFREVEDALVQEKKQLEQIRHLKEQVRLGRQSYERLKIEYFNGVSDYIDVLTALTDVQRLRQELISARLALLEFRIGLYRALAGGFETPREAQK